MYGRGDPSRYIYATRAGGGAIGRVGQSGESARLGTMRPMYRTQSPDTDPAIEAELFERYRRMSAVEKLAHVGGLGRMAEQLALGGLKIRYPDATEEQNRLRLLSRRVDRATMIRLYGWDPEVEGR